jgi:hypothetical protein
MYTDTMTTPPLITTDAATWADVIIAAAIATPADALIEASSPALWQASAGLRNTDDPQLFRIGLALGLQALLETPDALRTLVRQLRDDLGVEVAADLY